MVRRFLLMSVDGQCVWRDVAACDIYVNTVASDILSQKVTVIARESVEG